MLLDPRVVGRALDREVERDLQAVRVGGVDQPVEVVEGAELGVERVVAAFLAADGIGAARVVRPGVSVLLRPFRLARPIGWIGVK